MDPTRRIECGLELLMQNVLGPEGKRPDRLAEAMRHAVFPGGARIRPRLCIAVAASCNEDLPQLTDMAAAAVEMLHCASLVHDDLPCFDNAATRRGKPSTHRAYGEPLAVLAGDALIVLAFQALAWGAPGAPERLIELTSILCRAAGMPSGMVAGQGHECESGTSWIGCHAEKTGSLFAAATMAGAAASGAAALPWRGLGYLLGRAYQIADDIRDVYGSAQGLGKPIGQDHARDRPNAVHALGFAGAVGTMHSLFDEAMEAVPDCTGAGKLQDFIAGEAKRFMSPGKGAPRNDASNVMAR